MSMIYLIMGSPPRASRLRVGGPNEDVRSSGIVNFGIELYEAIKKLTFSARCGRFQLGERELQRAR
jgi:hypothetical protein